MADVEPGAWRTTRRLFQALEERGIRYCHWKSNLRLQATLAGMEDIDLLVDRRDLRGFHAALADAGFKLCPSKPSVSHPGVFNALALDDSTVELVHLHAYCQIVSGDSFVKSYRLPLERMLLNQTRCLDGVKVPAQETELMLFLLRVALKHVSPVEILKVNLHYLKVQAELAWLLDGSDVAEAEVQLRRWLPAVNPATLQQLLRATADRGALLHRVILGCRIAWQLREFRRLGIVSAFFSRQWRFASYVMRRLRHRRGLTPEAGGLIVALVGPKASGRSTVGRQLASRLGRYLAVTSIHAGKPPPTLLSWSPRMFVPIARRLLPHERLREYEKPERRREKAYSLFYVLRMLLLAHDRRALLFAALRQATSGVVVISDRYPSDTEGSIDSSCFDDEAQAKCHPPFKRWLMGCERKFYRGLPKPTLVLRLHTKMDTAVRRDAGRAKSGGPDAEAVRRRWHLETSAEFLGVPVVAIDTSGSLDETVRGALRAVWHAL